MRRITMFNRVSADGCFAGPDGGLDWVVPDDEVDKEGASGIPDTDTILFGRRTYQMFEAFWPQALKSASAADPHTPGRTSPQQQAFAVMLNETPKLVFSRTLESVGWHNSRLIRELDPREIEALKRGPGKGIVVMGSGSIVSQLAEHGLIDDYNLVVSPIVLGNGRPLFSGLAKRVKLELVNTKRYPSGNLLLHYARPQ